MTSKSKTSEWKPLTISIATVLQGGCSKDPVILDVISVYEDDRLHGETQFVEIAKGKQWVYKAALGPCAQKGSLHESKCIENLKTELDKAIADVEETSAVADATPPPKKGNPDPMAQLELRSAEKTQEHVRRKHHKKVLKRPADEVRIVMAPEEFGSEAKRPVKMLRGYRGKVFVELDAVPWLITLVREEVLCAGCVGVVSDPHGLQDSLSSTSGILAQTRSVLSFSSCAREDDNYLSMHSQRPNRIVCIRRPHCGAAVADQGASVACQGHAVADQEPTFAGQVPAVADQEPYLESTEQGPQLRNLVEIRDERARLERIV